MPDTSSESDTARLLEKLRRWPPSAPKAVVWPADLLREAADTIDALKAEVAKIAGNWKVIDQQAARIAKLESEAKDRDEAILELQHAACARDGVPMPSERPVVDKLRDRIAKLEAALREAHAYLDDMNMAPKLRRRITRALEDSQ